MPTWGFAAPVYKIVRQATKVHRGQPIRIKGIQYTVARREFDRREQLYVHWCL